MFGKDLGIKMNQIKNKFRGAVVGTAIGDALGAPIENMTKKDIQNQISTFNDYLDNIIRPSGIHKHTRNPGEWTDDSQFMIGLAKSIINKRSINPLDIANEMVNIYKNEELRGWSRSTIEAVDRLSRGIPWFRSADNSLGMGNGIAMKAVPLGLYLFGIRNKVQADIQHCLNSIICVGKITHHETGITAGLLQSYLISMALEGIRKKRSIVSNLKKMEETYFGNNKISGKVSESIKQKLSVEQLADMYGTDSRADHSWVTVAGLFIKTKSKKEAINNLFELIKQGQDTDTCGSMYAALIGARWGLSVFPKHLIVKLEKNKDLLELSDNLL